VVSVAALVRHRDKNDAVTHKLVSLPRYGDSALPESVLLQRFLEGAGKAKPQIVGFNISDADLPILLQRAAVCGVTAPGFCVRPDKPWEGRDYFTRYSDWLIDLQHVYGGWGRSTPSLHEIASAARIPGKIEASGYQVLDLWLKDQTSKIVAYNEFDVLTTFLLWLRTVRLAGLLPVDVADTEERNLRHYLEELALDGREYLVTYLEKWDELAQSI